MNRVSVALLPTLLDRELLPSSTAVVIDVLRATSVVATAFAAGAARVLTCKSIDEARRLANQTDGEALLCGERGGLPIPGFDLSNSPADYVGGVVGGKTLVLTTTNGTQALAAVRDARQAVTASLLNLTAVVRYVATASNVVVVCAGTDGMISSEDVLAAGGIACGLTEKHGFLCDGDQTMLATTLWQDAGDRVYDPEELAALLAKSQGGRNLVEIGYSEDIRRVAMLDQLTVVPERITLDPIELRSVQD